MNRQIKFRVWHKKERVFSYNACIGYNENLKPNGQPYGNYYEDGCEGQHYEDEVAIQQFTGLKDRNRKEIYEGDLVRPIGRADELWIIRWLNYKWVLVDNRIKLSGRAIRDLNNPYCEEVVGNIYEDNGLLLATA